MNPPVLRLLIQEKLGAGRLPHNDIAQFWGGPGSGKTCDGRDETVTNTQMLMEAQDATGRRVQFHVACFHLWDVERRARARGGPPGPAGQGGSS
jgi:hypothetical protein